MLVFIPLFIGIQFFLKPPNSILSSFLGGGGGGGGGGGWGGGGGGGHREVKDTNFILNQTKLVRHFFNQWEGDRCNTAV